MGRDLRRGDVLIQELFRDGVYAGDGERFEILRVTVGPARVALEGFIESRGWDLRMLVKPSEAFVTERPESPPP